LSPEEPLETSAFAGVGSNGTGDQDQVGVTVDRALDVLEELMRSDPDQARQIRVRMAAMLG
jgi:hypothetical protein